MLTHGGAPSSRRYGQSTSDRRPPTSVDAVDRRPHIRLSRQIAIVAAAVAAYFLVRGATDAAITDALVNANKIIDFEVWLGIYHEQALQSSLATSPNVTTVLNWIYIWGHWPVIVVTLLWLARRHPAIYLRTRNAMLVSGGIGLIAFAAFPVAPPRLAGLGMIDTVTVSSEAYRVLQPAMVTNQFAAMPSLHVGWDLLIGLAVLAAARRPLVKALGVFMPVAMFVAVVLTANHYIIDAVVGAALTTACWVAVGWWQRRRAASTTLAGPNHSSSPPATPITVRNHPDRPSGIGDGSGRREPARRPELIGAALSSLGPAHVDVVEIGAAGVQQRDQAHRVVPGGQRRGRGDGLIAGPRPGAGEVDRAA